MAYIKINQKKVDDAVAQKLMALCPFNAFDYIDSYLSVNAACKLCKLCVKHDVDGVCELVESQRPNIDKTRYQGIAVYIEHRLNQAHPVSWELLGKARELAEKTSEPVFALVVGHRCESLCQEALRYGADRVYVYEHKAFEPFSLDIHTRVVAAFHEAIQLNVLLLGGTPFGRSFAPRIAAKLKTGLTADCTSLDITPAGDLLQIRPAFGGNIMAKIHTPNHRPQLATIRHKMFESNKQAPTNGDIMKMPIDTIELANRIEILASEEKPRVQDISDAEVIIAVGRAFKKQKDLELIEPLRRKLNAELACTRPLIENGWFDPRRQIGLSGRTVKPKLLINLGISGAVQYIEGIKGAELIISINHDPDNRLFDVSHVAIVGDVYTILPTLNERLEQLGVMHA